MINKLFLKLLFITSVLLISSCDIFQNYEDCGWLRIEDGNIDQFYQVGNNGERINIVSIGDALYGDNLIRCNWIHLYKDDNELKIEYEEGGGSIFDLSNAEYEYAKL